MDKEMILSSGNVFADLGLPDAGGLMVKADLMAQIQAAMERKGLTQKQLADLVGLDQPKISKLLRGQFGGFSIDRLFFILNRLGHEVQVHIDSTEREDAQTLILAA
ncbi:XRE family transcriptional regulator [bacterium]|nr:MAG: XRE family transcriptional regulator [bacterium]